jgi:hypothetical protein
VTDEYAIALEVADAIEATNPALAVLIRSFGGEFDQRFRVISVADRASLRDFCVGQRVWEDL